MKQTNDNTGNNEIVFSNGNRARLVAPAAGTPAASVLKTLEIGQPKALIMIAGGAGGLDEALKPHLLELFSKGIAPAAADIDALTIDGGTQAGVMAMMGEGVAETGRNSILLGVAPAGKVTYPGGPANGSIEDGAPLDSNHSHFVLVESDEWGGETKTMYELAEELSKEIPLLTILINGGEVARHEILQSVCHGWAIIVIEGTGRLADEIAIAVREKTKPSSEEMAAIVTYDRLVLFDIEEGPEALAALIRRKLLLER
ncbi:MAG: hypothetical protein ACYTDW_00735 [Planctomycetota bacterium]|jgi:hypothetical protein